MPRLLLLLALLLAACGAPEPTPSFTPVARQEFQPLPGNVSGIPGPDSPTARVAAQSRAGGWPIGVARVLTLGHCGLGSPLDFDGSLWDPVGGHDGRGAAIAEEQLGELINATDVAVTLVDTRTAWLVTGSGAVVLLARHAGPRNYLLCD
jgi:hypothetical protein